MMLGSSTGWVSDAVPFCSCRFHNSCKPGFAADSFEIRGSLRIPAARAPRAAASPLCVGDGGAHDQRAADADREMFKSSHKPKPFEEATGRRPVFAWGWGPTRAGGGGAPPATK